jgi:hypothetical protein
MWLSSCSEEKRFTKICIENQNTHFMFINFLSENRAIYEIMWKKYGRTRQVTDGGTARALCVLDI